MLTVVMYHYVRDPARTSYPNVKALLTDEFEQQLAYIARTYEVVALQDVVCAVQGGPSLPQDACLLTFDDGLIDHYETVLPRVSALDMPAAFFPPGLPIVERVLLDVHKIQFILAAAPDPAEVVAAMLERLERMRATEALPSSAELRAEHERQDRFDTPAVMLIKGVLQHGLAPHVRAQLVDDLFASFVHEDAYEFANELYMSVEHLRELVRQGMDVGGHGWSHVWLETLSAQAQLEEIRGTVDLLGLVYGTPPDDWTMCYPYGSYNTHTLALIRRYGAAVGLTTVPGVAPDLQSPLELARLDTNDLPPKSSSWLGFGRADTPAPLPIDADA